MGPLLMSDMSRPGTAGGKQASQREGGHQTPQGSQRIQSGGRGLCGEGHSLASGCHQKHVGTSLGHGGRAPEPSTAPGTRLVLCERVRAKDTKGPKLTLLSAKAVGPRSCAGSPAAL